MAAWTVALYAAALSGLVALMGSLPLKQTDTSGTSNKDNLVYVGLVAKLVETGMGGRCVKVNTLEKGVYLDGGLGGG